MGKFVAVVLVLGFLAALVILALSSGFDPGCAAC